MPGSVPVDIVVLLLRAGALGDVVLLRYALSSRFENG